ncbi:MAG: phospholipase A [Bdellovibrionota bacterium]
MKLFLIIYLASISLFAQDTSQVNKDDKPQDEKENFFTPQVLKNKEALEEEDNLNLLRHQPLYFAYGDPSSKVQLSFKYRIIKDTPIYFAYTQIMFWDLKEDSKPFKDSTYNPEFIYTYDLEKKIFLDAIDFGIWEHNSNGKSGDESRSFERAFVRLNFAREFKDVLFKFSTKIGYIYGLDKTNDDIRDYISPLELKFSLIGVFQGWTMDRSSFDLRYFPGGDWAQDWGRGGYELSTSFRFGGLSIVPAFYMQYFRGYAESLINYNERVSEFRAGFIF